MKFHGFLPARWPFAMVAAVLAFVALPLQAQAQKYPPAWSAAATYAVGDQVQLNGNVLRATHAVLAGGFKYDEWELWEVRSNTNVMIGVGQTFANLLTGWNYARNARVANGAYLHLYISTAHGTLNETFTAPLSLDHQSGGCISIIGDDQPNINLTFPSDGLTLDTSHAIALISGLTLSGVAGTGILLTGNASIGNVSHTTISGFGTGIDAEQGANVSCDSTIKITGFGTAIIAQRNGSVVVGPNVSFSGDLFTSTGFYEAYGGYIEATHCSITSCQYGAVSTQGGEINLEHASIYGNHDGVYLVMKGHIDCEYATFSQPSLDLFFDAYVFTGSTLDVTSSNYTAQLHSIGTNDGSYIYGP